MKRLILTGAVVFASSISYADGLYWVVGNRATATCDIVGSNPVIHGGAAYDGTATYWFGSGPYRSKDDAKLARSTINACPKDEEQDSADDK